MVIPYAGALSFFLGLVQLLPLPVATFLTTSLMVSLGAGFLKWLVDNLR